MNTFADKAPVKDRDTTGEKSTLSLADTVAATTAARSATVAEKTSKKSYETPKVIKFLDGTMDTVIVAIIMFMLAFSAFAMWDTDNMHESAMSHNYEIWNPAEDPLSFEELRALNPDVFGWLTVYGTMIDYPLVQGETNSFYVNHNVFREFSLAGAIFLDVSNNPNFTDFNSIIHGHFMDQRAKFGDISLFQEREFFDSRRYGNLFFNDRDHGLEFFALIETSGYNWEIYAPGIEERERQIAYLENVLDIAMHVRDDVPVTIEDRIVLLSTCTNNIVNGRHLLVAKLHDEPFENPFGEEEKAARERTAFVDGELLPFMRTICAPALLLVAVLVMLYWAIQKRRRWSVEDKWALIEANPALLAKLEAEGLGLKKESKDAKPEKSTKVGKADRVRKPRQQPTTGLGALIHKVQDEVNYLFKKPATPVTAQQTVVQQSPPSPER